MPYFLIIGKFFESVIVEYRGVAFDTRIKNWYKKTPSPLGKRVQISED